MSTTTTNTDQRSDRKSHFAVKYAELNARYDAWCDTTEAKILTVVWTAVLVLVTAVVLFGYPALILAALAAVPSIFFVLWLITVGK